MDCSIQTEKTEDLAIIHVGGYIDAHTFEELESEVEEILAASIFRVAMELSRVSYCSSAGIGVLVNIRANCQADGGNLVLINPAECLVNVMKTFGIWDLFTVMPDKAKAIAALKSA